MILGFGSRGAPGSPAESVVPRSAKTTVGRAEASPTAPTRGAGESVLTETGLSWYGIVPVPIRSYTASSRRDHPQTPVPEVSTAGSASPEQRSERSSLLAPDPCNKRTVGHPAIGAGSCGTGSFGPTEREPRSPPASTSGGFLPHQGSAPWRGILGAELENRHLLTSLPARRRSDLPHFFPPTETREPSCCE